MNNQNNNAIRSIKLKPLRISMQNPGQREKREKDVAREKWWRRLKTSTQSNKFMHIYCASRLI